ncbi:MAG: aldehyde dehydrogenase family protein, partial [Bradymonadaceae bacterium]
MTETKFPFSARDYDFVPYVPCNNWIGGEWAPSASGRTEEVYNPRHGKSMGSVVYSDKSDVQAAFDVAKAAFQGWKEWPIRERAQ